MPDNLFPEEYENEEESEKVSEGDFFDEKEDE